MRNKIFLQVLVFAILFPYCLSASEFGSGLQQGVRQEGMGEAFTGLADDGEAVYYNSAGLTNLTNIEAIIMYSRQLAGLTMGQDEMGINVSYAGYAQNFGDKIGSFAIRWYYRGYSQGSIFTASENNIMVGYGRSLMDIPGFKESKYLKSLSAGLGLHFLGWKFSDIDGMKYFAGYSELSSWNVGLNLSLFYKMNDNFSFGTQINDIVWTNLTTSETVKSDYTDPMDFRFGTAWKYNPENKRDIVNLDFASENNRSSINLGSERSFDFKYKNNLDRIIARGGLQIGLDDYYAFSFGFGYLFTNMGEKLSLNDVLGIPMDMQFDYALKIQSGEIEESPMNHSFQFTFFLDKSKRRIASAELPSALEESEDVPVKEEVSEKKKVKNRVEEIRKKMEENENDIGKDVSVEEE